MEENLKQLLVVDLSARLPYGVKIMFSSNGFRWDWEQTLEEITKCDDGEYAINGWGIHGIKPYLRPMSSMTEEEEKEFDKVFDIELKALEAPEGHTLESAASNAFVIDFYNKYHFDYRGLIDKGLAIEVTEENNPYKEIVL